MKFLKYDTSWSSVTAAFGTIFIAALALFAIVYAGSENTKRSTQRAHQEAEAQVLKDLGISQVMYSAWKDGSDDRVFAFSHEWQGVDGMQITDNVHVIEDIRALGGKVRQFTEATHGQ